MDMSLNDHAAFFGGDPASAAGAGLRPLSWHGLCARIAATQDLRRSLGAEGECGDAERGGSFHRLTAAFIASNVQGNLAHERVVNPNSSSKSKADLGTFAADMTVTRQGRAEARD